MYTSDIKNLLAEKKKNQKLLLIVPHEVGRNANIINAKDLDVWLADGSIQSDDLVLEIDIKKAYKAENKVILYNMTNE